MKRTFVLFFLLGISTNLNSFAPVPTLNSTTSEHAKYTTYFKTFGLFAAAYLGSKIAAVAYRDYLLQKLSQKIQIVVDLNNALEMSICIGEEDKNIQRMFDRVLNLTKFINFLENHAALIAFPASVACMHYAEATTKLVPTTCEII